MKKIVIISVAVLGVMVALFALSARKPSDQSSLSESDVFSLYIPDKDWQIYDETLEEPAQMAAVFSSEISIWVDYYAEKPLDVEARLLSEGYGYDTEGKKMQKTEGELLLEARIVGQQNDTWVIGSSYPAEYECGPRLGAIADTFEVAANQEENSSRTEQDEVYRNLIKEMLDTGIFPATEGTQFDGLPYDNYYCVVTVQNPFGFNNQSLCKTEN